MSIPAEDVQTESGIKYLTDEEAAELFDARAQRHFGISGPEWVKRWRAGCYHHLGDTRDHMYMLFSLPLVGEDPWQGRSQGE